ncbi:hypothetical protein BDF22DRAFT_741267 [Syncephalis plumigaleata]|nr:hypothetical protein BDF22DRAFT_741267 [Syncephalis plumigaleata]
MMSLRFVPQQQQAMSNQRPRNRSIPSQVPIQPQQLHHSSSKYPSKTIILNNNNNNSSSNNNNNTPLTPITPSSSPIHSVKAGFSYQPSNSPFILVEQQQQQHTGNHSPQHSLPSAVMKTTTSSVPVTSNIAHSTFGTLSPVVSSSSSSNNNNMLNVTLPNQSASLVQSTHPQYNSINLLQNKNMQLSANQRQQPTPSPPLSALPASVQSATLNTNESTAATSALFHNFITAIMEGRLKPIPMDDTISYILSLATLHNTLFSQHLARLSDQQLDVLNRFYTQLSSTVQQIHARNTIQNTQLPSSV